MTRMIKQVPNADYDGPFCMVCQEPLPPSAAATIIVQGPNVGRFIHLRHKRTKGDIYAGEQIDRSKGCVFP